MAKKISKSEAIRRLTSAVPEGAALFGLLVGLGDEVWKEDPARDRTAAIMGGSFLEHALKVAIRHHLKPDEVDPDFNYLFVSPEAPYREFAGRLRLARALGIVSKGEYDQLEAIRLIRNAFAHTMAEVTFATPEIAVYFDDFDILDQSGAFSFLASAFAPEYSILGSITSERANRMVFAHTVFLFYWKLTNYPGQNELAKLTKIWRLASSA